MKAIKQLADLFEDQSADGSITSGGTESNITGLWMGRNSLRAKGSKKICVLATKLSHACMVKAANILDLDIIYMPIDKNYGLDSSRINPILKDLKKKHYDGFIFYLTSGYFTTGASDDITAICNILENKNSVYVHIDACIGGFITPFIDPKSVANFKTRLVSSISIDPHKMGLLPYSCGVFLCRSSMSKYIETTNELAHFTERTLSGSRSGAYASALWSVLNTLGREGYRNIVKRCLKNKKYFIQKIIKYDPQVRIISFENMVNFAVHFSSLKNGVLPREIEKKYRLVANKLPSQLNPDKEENYYHFFSLPHMSIEAIDFFINSLPKEVQG